MSYKLIFDKFAGADLKCDNSFWTFLPPQKTILRAFWYQFFLILDQKFHQKTFSVQNLCIFIFA